MQMKEFRLPDPGEGLVEAEIVTWRVAVGDEVKVNDIVVEVETSKSLVELPIPFAGKVAALLVSEGDVVDVGAPIISIDETGSAAPDGGPKDDLVPVVPGADEAEIGEGESAEDAPGGRVAVLVGYGAKAGETKRRPRKAAAASAPGEVREHVADPFSTSAPVSFRPDVRTSMPPLEAEPVGKPLPRPGAVHAEPGPARGAVLAKPPVRKLGKILGLTLPP